MIIITILKQNLVSVPISLVETDSHTQCAKKVVSNRLGQVDFAIGLASEFITCPSMQVKFWEEFKFEEEL